MFILTLSFPPAEIVTVSAVDPGTHVIWSFTPEGSATTVCVFPSASVYDKFIGDPDASVTVRSPITWKHVS